MAASWLASQFFVLFFMERELLQLFTLRTRPKARLSERKKKNRVHLNGVPIFGLKKDKEDIALVGFKKLKLNLKKRKLRNIKP